MVSYLKVKLLYLFNARNIKEAPDSARGARGQTLLLRKTDVFRAIGQKICFHAPQSKCERFFYAQNPSKRFVSSLRCFSFPGRENESLMKGVSRWYTTRVKGGI